ncbi:Unknown protein [Striga hermonthica]|uniref:Uncharacterized protein n=1 Tax=Striga hermonthica TaxID=68872 RepID=A0A9N7NVR4_STRHE|nr:Unknown protein [Striga hermonthica]
MEESAPKDQSSASETGRSTTRLLRYPLRSATKLKDEKPPVAGSANSISAAKRERAPSSVSKSVGVLDLSGKEKSSAKLPRRLSVPNRKPNATPTPKSAGSITPICETRAKSAIGQGKSDTPRSDISKSSARKKFSTLSSASYWLSQIKLSESASKHSISLGFFKLALEAGCETIQRLSDELKSYVRRHDLSEHGEDLKFLLEGFKIPESFELSQVSGKCLQAPSGGSQYSDDDVKSSSSSITYAEETQKNAHMTQHVKKANKENSEKDGTVKATKRSVPKRAASSKPDLEVKAVYSIIMNPASEETREDNKENTVESQMSEHPSDRRASPTPANIIPRLAVTSEKPTAFRPRPRHRPPPFSTVLPPPSGMFFSTTAEDPDDQFLPRNMKSWNSEDEHIRWSDAKVSFSSSGHGGRRVFSVGSIVRTAAKQGGSGRRLSGGRHGGDGRVV